MKYTIRFSNDTYKSIRDVKVKELSFSCAAKKNTFN